MTNNAFLFPRHHGNYYVRYKDGKKSGLMDKDIARDYAEIFGGTVYRESEENMCRNCDDSKVPFGMKVLAIGSIFLIGFILFKVIIGAI